MLQTLITLPILKTRLKKPSHVRTIFKHILDTVSSILCDPVQNWCKPILLSKEKWNLVLFSAEPWLPLRWNQNFVSLLGFRPTTVPWKRIFSGAQCLPSRCAVDAITVRHNSLVIQTQSEDVERALRIACVDASGSWMSGGIAVRESARFASDNQLC